MRFSSANAVCFVVVDSLSRTMQTPFAKENWIYLVTNAIIINSQQTLDFPRQKGFNEIGVRKYLRVQITGQITQILHQKPYICC